MAVRLVAVLGTEGTFWRTSTRRRGQGTEEFGEWGLWTQVPLPLPEAVSPRGPGVLILPSQKGAAEVLSRGVYAKQDFLPCSGEGVGGGQVSGGCLMGCWSPRGSLVPPKGHPRDALSRWCQDKILGPGRQGRGSWTQLE